MYFCNIDATKKTLFLNFIVLNNILIAYYKCKPLSNEVVYKWLVWYKMSLNVILAVDRGVR